MSESFLPEEIEQVKEMKKASISLLMPRFITRSRSAFSEHAVLAGGWFARFIRKEPQRNADIFILCGNDKSKYQEYRYDFIAEMYKEGLEFSLNEPTYLPKDMCWEVITDQAQKPKIRYIFSKQQDRKELVSKFDFLHCTISFDVKTQMLYASSGAFHAAKNKVLIANEGQTHTHDRLKRFAVEEGYKYGHGCNVISILKAEKNENLNPGSEYETYHYSFEDEPDE